MIILGLRTDRPEAEIRLYDDTKLLGKHSWQAHRKLGETLHQQIAKLLQKHDLGWSDLKGVVIYKGPGSFTGLRIGMSVANALALSLTIKVAEETGDDWAPTGVERLARGEGKAIGQIEYGAPAHVTQQKK